MMSDYRVRKLPVSEDLSESYKNQIEEQMKAEALRRIADNHDPEEIDRLSKLSLIKLFQSNDSELIPALMSRLGPVRAALDGHGGALIVSSGEIEQTHDGTKVLSLIIDLDGACVSCGAAPGTLKGIQDDLLIDDEIISVRFSVSMLEWFDEIQKEFVLKFGGVVFA
jgi:Fe-S cluster biogenesis protein NfuA